MTAATITDRIEVNDPIKEVVVLTFTDTETYVSRKFSTLLAVQATLMEDTGALEYPVSCDISGGTVTLNCEGVTDKLICLVLYGRK